MLNITPQVWFLPKVASLWSALLPYETRSPLRGNPVLSSRLPWLRVKVLSCYSRERLVLIQMLDLNQRLFIQNMNALTY